MRKVIRARQYNTRVFVFDFFFFFTFQEKKERKLPYYPLLPMHSINNFFSRITNAGKEKMKLGDSPQGGKCIDPEFSET